MFLKTMLPVMLRNLSPSAARESIAGIRLIMAKTGTAAALASFNSSIPLNISPVWI